MGTQELRLRYEFNTGEKTLANRLKIKKEHDYFQLYVNNGDRFGGYRLSRDQAHMLMLYLQEHCNG